MVVADVCAINPLELQPNGNPCGPKCCREKGNCVHNHSTGVCSPAPADTCLRDGQGEVCLRPCCDAKPAEENCEFDINSRQCLTKADPVDACIIPVGFLLDNGNTCKQECCRVVRGALNPKGCIWNHQDKTCSQKPDDVCVDEVGQPGTVCLTDCCVARSRCLWNPQTRQCLTDPAFVPAP